eukprot:CAMPEP_0178427262 /NCGR_PEP_ID=MMETSP0689_2-20121128/29654_1 /TAXON_ID=160604 /ORGANISM="Amphidinium massartii, Strain CS-259" /LENGTH=254 /DNA_ID=CAMNT_0020048963 /DNA_START=12 /DNA_END=773 /DNA_ORIENTATION=-
MCSSGAVALPQDWAESQELCADPTFMVEAVSQNWENVAQASSALLGDQDFMFQAVHFGSWQVMKYASEELRGDYDFMAKVLEEHSFAALIFASEVLRGNIEFMLQALKENSLAAELATTTLRGNREFMRHVVTLEPTQLSVASDQLLEDESFLDEIAEHIQKLLILKVTLLSGRSCVVVWPQDDEDLMQHTREVLLSKVADKLQLSPIHVAQAELLLGMRPVMWPDLEQAELLLGMRPVMWPDLEPGRVAAGHA